MNMIERASWGFLGGVLIGVLVALIVWGSAVAWLVAVRS